MLNKTASATLLAFALAFPLLALFVFASWSQAMP